MLAKNNSSQSNSLDKFDRLVYKCKIYIDTSSLLNFAFNRWLKKYLPILQKQGQSIIILPKVYSELKLNLNNTDLEIVSVTKDVIKKVTDINGLIDYEETDIYKASPNYFNDFFKTKNGNKYVLITNDYDIFKGIDCDIRIIRINKSSDISKFRPDDISKIDKRIIRLNKTGFRTEKTIINSGDISNSVGKIPAKNDFVFDDKGNRIRILDLISSGGEGIIYLTDTQYVAKIYKRESNTKHKLKN